MAKRRSVETSKRRNPAEPRPRSSGGVEKSKSRKVKKSKRRPRKSARAGARGKPSREARIDNTLRVLFTCVGRRIELLNAFRRAGERLRIKLEVHGADASAMSPGYHQVNRAHLVPTIASGGYVDALAEVIRRHKIGLLIPLIDTELPHIAAAAPRFAELGCRALVSSPRVVQVCGDKLDTYRVLREAGVDTPQTWAWEELLHKSGHRFPYYMKPRGGSAAKGNYVIRELEDLRTLGRLVEQPIVQEFVDGVEHTLDVYTGLDGVPRCVVPRRRLEVRTGEVSKSLIVKDEEVMQAGRRVAEVLGECRGVITVQCMRTVEGRIRVIEVNPRFGGGAPLSIHAGADFPRWILAEHLGRKCTISPTGFRDDVAMLRYDESVFVTRASRYLQSRNRPNTRSPDSS
jgi:carbamoyl-phosphate synthase large subunit